MLNHQEFYVFWFNSQQKSRERFAEREEYRLPHRGHMYR